MYNNIMHDYNTMHMNHDSAYISYYINHAYYAFLMEILHQLYIYIGYNEINVLYSIDHI